TSGEAKGLPEGMLAKIQNHAKRIYRVLNLSGYARIDLRLDPTGKVYVLEANPNPEIAHGEDFADSAEKSGLPYKALLQRIINLGLRWQPDRLG
ncbi:MAG: D-alanine--D-alanine ligase, partial [Candidatus Methylomirabilales bacterium]